MAYSLAALIGAGAAPPGTVPLPQGAWLRPLTADTHDAAELSRTQPVAFVTAEFFGGAGAQCATLYRDGRVVQEFPSGCTAINAALAALGITTEPASDAFDTLRLGRYRHTEDWLAAIAPPPSP